MKDILIICGGTGGHLSPGIALAEELDIRGYSNLLCISHKTIDSAIIKKYSNLNFKSFYGIGFSSNLRGKFLFLHALFSSLPSIVKVLIHHKPKVVFLFGGYLSVGFGLVSALLGYNIVLHEANARVGKAVRLLQRFAKRVYMPEGVKYCTIKGSKLRSMGYPLRKEMRLLDRKEARKQIGIDSNGLLLLVVGGSQGAEVLNKWVIDNYESLAEEGISIYCISGLNNGLASNDVLINSQGQKVSIKMVPFSENMAAVFSSGDLLISRAGGGTIAEIIKCKIPSILIPYPNSADNHQLHNAKIHENLGAGILIEQKNIDHLFDEVKALIHNENLLKQIEINLENLNKEDTAELIVNDLESIVDLK